MLSNYKHNIYNNLSCYNGSNSKIVPSLNANSDINIFYTPNLPKIQYDALTYDMVGGQYVSYDKAYGSCDYTSRVFNYGCETHEKYYKKHYNKASVDGGLGMTLGKEGETCFTGYDGGSCSGGFRCCYDTPGICINDYYEENTGSHNRGVCVKSDDSCPEGTVEHKFQIDNKTMCSDKTVRVNATPIRFPRET